MDFSSQKGQIILIVILAMVVGLTVGLAVVSRSITNIRITTDEKNSQAALAAAEAGIEQAAKSQDASKTTFSSNLGNNSSYTTNIQFQTGTDFLLQDGKPIAKNEGGDIWFIAHNANGTPNYSSTLWNGNLSIAFGTASNACENPALEIIVLSGPIASPRTTRSVYDPCAIRRQGNKFGSTAPGRTINSVSFSHGITIAVTNGIVARVIPLYKSGKVGFSATGLPSQGKLYESVGSSSQTKRKIVVFEDWPTLPIELFQYSLLVPGT